MNFRKSHRESRMLDVDITPMIDVVFLLIIFFMTTAQFARMTRAEVELPVQVGEDEKRESRASLVVNIEKTGLIIVENETVSLDRLANMVAAETAANADVQLWIRADRLAPAETMNSVAERLNRIGVTNWRLATRSPGRSDGGTP
jgi:biopolymer transport protein ExbD